MNTGRYVEEKNENGRITETVRFNTNRKYTKEEKEAMLKQFSKDAKAGKVICLTDLMINHGM